MKTNSLDGAPQCKEIPPQEKPKVLRGAPPMFPKTQSIRKACPRRFKNAPIVTGRRLPSLDAVTQKSCNSCTFDVWKLLVAVKRCMPSNMTLLFNFCWSCCLSTEMLTLVKFTCVYLVRGASPTTSCSFLLC